jgi:penicillin-binding protein 2
MALTPNRPGPAERRLTRRGLLLLGAQGAMMAGLAFRMRQLQVDQASQFRLMAEENRINIRLIPPARGRVFDRQGRALAANRSNYRVVLIREQARDPEDVLDRRGRCARCARNRRSCRSRWRSI